ncbi:unnamed protein product [Microthlaspi erraticum]|uniref:C3H1-type domain-containing protein n=1 Tax=Microthlaspi erraticum TaxID=1685480 RepID=A0A6D2JES5_9BRAS|nr:unnamed protein product [Microthlaspi erraticum]
MSVVLKLVLRDKGFNLANVINGFILDGKVLKAYFGKNNYCHAWIRNGACTNPDCLYLHEICSLEDSFTKDKVISVQKITGTSNALQYCSGSMLPPPLDGYCSDSSTIKFPSTTKSTRDEGPGAPADIGSHCDQGSIRRRGNNVPNTDAEADIAQNGNPGLRPEWDWRSQMPVNSTLNKSNWSELAEANSYVAKLLDESDRKASTLEPSNLLQQQNDQSRFSFPRHEKSNNQACDYNNTYCMYGQRSRDQSTLEFGQSQNGFASNLSGGYEQFAASPALRSQVSAPPGFSVPSTSRLPPPGFSSHETSDIASGTRLLDSSSVLRNAYHAPPPSSNLNTGGDVEFMDPAVLSVGRGIFHNGMETADFDMSSRSGFSSHPNSFENGARLQSLAQRSLAAQQVNGFHDPRNVNNISPSLFDPYENSLRLMDQTQGTRFSSLTRLPRQASLNPLFSNGRWDQWNETQSGNNTLGMTQLQDNVYSRLEEPRFPRPGPGDPYNRT